MTRSGISPRFAYQFSSRLRCGHPCSKAENRLGIDAFSSGRRLSGRRDDDRLFRHDKHLVERRVGDRLGHKSRIEFAGEDRRAERRRIAGPQFKRHVGMAAVIFVQRCRQSDRRGAFHRAEAKQAARLRIAHRCSRLVGHREQALGIAEQCLSCWREMQPLALPDEQRDVEIILELADTRGDVRLDAIQVFRRTGDAALAYHGCEDAQV